MECGLCNSLPRFQCTCRNILLCEKCIIQHVVSSAEAHTVTEISAKISITVYCDSCKKNPAQIRCICQEEKQKFCYDCVASHLEIKSTHCIDSIDNQIYAREMLKYQEKRKKIEYLTFDVKRNLDSLREFADIVKNSKVEAMKQLEESFYELQDKAQIFKLELKGLFDDLQAKVVPSVQDNSIAEILINKTDSQNLEKVDKYLSLIEASFHSESALKAIKSACRLSILGNDNKIKNN